MVENAFNLAVTLPAVLVGFGVGTLTGGAIAKLLVSGGVTRGRVARDAREGTTPPKDMTSRAQAQKQPGSRVVWPQPQRRRKPGHIVRARGWIRMCLQRKLLDGSRR